MKYYRPAGRELRSMPDFITIAWRIMLTAPLLFQGIPPVHASVIADVLEASQAVIQIRAESGGVVKAEKGKTVLDPRTGTLLTPGNVQAFRHVRQGAGVIVDPSGLILTNAHTVDQAQRVLVALHDGTVLLARPLMLASARDLALLKVDAGKNLPHIPFSDSDRIRLGSTVYSVGTSSFLRNTISEGKISGLGQRRNSSEGPQTELLRIDFEVYHGDSGSPILDSDGRLLGLTAAGESSGNHETYAIPSNVMTLLLSTYRQKAEQMQKAG